MPIHHIKDDKVVQSVHADFTFDGSTTVAVGEIPTNASVLQVIVIKDAPFDVNDATLQVGMAGNENGLADTSDIDLTKMDGDVRNQYFTTGFPIPVIATMNPKSATQGQGRVIVTYIEQ